MRTERENEREVNCLASDPMIFAVLSFFFFSRPLRHCLTHREQPKQICVSLELNRYLDVLFQSTRVNMGSGLNAWAPEFRPTTAPLPIPSLPEDPFDLNNPSEVNYWSYGCSKHLDVIPPDTGVGGIVGMAVLSSGTGDGAVLCSRCLKACSFKVVDAVVRHRCVN